VLEFSLPDDVSVLCLGAHPDDIEIGCGGTLLALAEAGMTLTNVILTASPDRALEAAHAAALVHPQTTVVQRTFPDGRLPAVWDEVKDVLEKVAASVDVDVVFAPRPDDAHQDHRLLGTLASTVWRDQLLLHYEIPKWDGDLGNPTHYVPLTEAQVGRKLHLLDTAFPSQTSRDWWDEETFRALLRLRGIECRQRYAEAFWVAKTVLRVGSASGDIT